MGEANTLVPCYEATLPRWIPSYQECVWCRQYSLVPMFIENQVENLIIHYECHNVLCEHARRNNFNAKFGLIFHGAKFVENLEIFLKEEVERQKHVEDM